MTSIILLNYNAWEDILNEIEIAHNTLGINYNDIIVIDNKSTDDSVLHLQNKEFVFIESNKNYGYAKGNNIGLRYSYDKGYKYSLILNSDIVIGDKELLNKLKKVLKNDDLIATVNPDIYSPNEYLYNRDAKRPTFFDLTLGMHRYKAVGRKIDIIDDYGYVYRPQGCCMLVDLKKMNDVDYFDENTFLYNEEIILAERLLKKGYRCACCVNAKVIHNNSVTIKKSFTKNDLIKIKQTGFKYYLIKYRKFNLAMIKICMFFNYLKLQFLK